MKSFILYEHVSPEGKKYIGITSKKDPNDRWLDGEGYNYNKYFYSDIQKFGWNNFKHNVLLIELSQDDAAYYERYYIAKYKTNDRYYGYNLTSGGEIYSGWSYSEEARLLISSKTKEAMQKPEVRKRFLEAMNNPVRRKKISEKNTGKIMSEETKEKLRQANIGKNNPNFGKKRKPLTEEQKRRISEGTKKAMQNLSEESKNKMIQSNKNRIPWNKGKTLSEEQRKRISEGTKKAMANPDVRAKCGKGMKEKALKCSK